MDTKSTDYANMARTLANDLQTEINSLLRAEMDDLLAIFDHMAQMLEELARLDYELTATPRGLSVLDALYDERDESDNRRFAAEQERDAAREDVAKAWAVIEILVAALRAGGESATKLALAVYEQALHNASYEQAKKDGR